MYAIPRDDPRVRPGSGSFDMAEAAAWPFMAAADRMSSHPRAAGGLAKLGRAARFGTRAMPYAGTALVALGSIPAIAEGAQQAGGLGAGISAVGNIGGAVGGGVIGGMLGGPLAPITAPIGAAIGSALGGGAAGAANGYIAQAINDPTSPVGKALDPITTNDLEREMAYRQEMADFMRNDPLRRMLQAEEERRNLAARTQALRDLQLQAIALN